MNRISRCVGSSIDLAFAVFDNGQPIIGAVPTFTVQCVTPTSSRYLQFYDVLLSSWQASAANNVMVPVVSNQGLFTAGFTTEHSENYLIVLSSNTTPNVVEVELWEIGSLASVQLQQVHQYLLAPRRELSRINGDLGIVEKIFDAKVAGKEVLRLTSTQDPSGAQPEETRVNDTDLIV